MSNLHEKKDTEQLYHFLLHIQVYDCLIINVFLLLIYTIPLFHFWICTIYGEIMTRPNLDQHIPTPKAK